ncbi:phage baseplate assembly protein, partial [Fangia hongkongensis]
MSDNIKLYINGQGYVGFTNINVKKTFLDLCGTYSASVPITKVHENYPIKLGDKCRVEVNDSAFLTGYVEKISINQDSSTAMINISGRDKTCDLVDTTIDQSIISQFNGVIYFDDLCKKIINKIKAPIDVV